MICHIYGVVVAEKTLNVDDIQIFDVYFTGMQLKTIMLSFHILTAVWLHDNAFVSINQVTLSRSRLVLGWVTVCWRANHLGM